MCLTLFLHSLKQTYQILEALHRLVVFSAITVIASFIAARNFVFRMCLASRSPRPPCFSPQRVVSSALRRCGNEFELKPQWMMEVCVYDRKRQ